METAITQWTSLGGLIGLIAYVIWQDWRAGKLTSYKSQDTDATKKLQDGMDYMKMHFNDELTGILTELQVGQREMRECQVKQGATLAEVNESLRDIVRNGVRIRK